MAQLWKIRLPDGRTLTPGDWTSAEPLYSTVEFGVGGFPILTAYSYGLGGEVPGSIGPRDSSLADTNLEGEGSRLPENEELICYNIAVEMFHIGGQSQTDLLPPIDPPDVSLLNMLRVQRDLVVVTRIAFIKEYTRSPVSYWPSAMGVVGYHAGGRSEISIGQFGYVNASNGSTSTDDMRVLASPLYVAGGESLAVDFIPGPGLITNLDAETVALADDGRIRCRIYLDGYRRRPVA